MARACALRLGHFFERYHASMKHLLLLRAPLLAGGLLLASASLPLLAPAAVAAAPSAAAGQLTTHSFNDLNGKPQSMADWKGKPIVVNFWATWCAPCVKEMPELSSLQKRFPGAHFVGIGVDSVQNIKQFTSKVPVAYPLWVRGSDTIELMRNLGNGPGGLPFTVILDGDGSVAANSLGPVKSADVAQTLKKLGVQEQLDK
jgi:thiol-disulfide isomerase/thioredoxin